MRGQAANPKGADATVYAVRGDNLVPSGQVLGLPAAVLSAASLQLSNDARQLTAILRPTPSAPSERLLRSVTSLSAPAVARPGPAADTAAASARPAGAFAVREEPGGNAPSRALAIVKRADGAVVRTIRGAGLRYRFSSDDRWLAAWNRDGVHVLDLAQAETAWIWGPIDGHAVDLARADEQRDRHVSVETVQFEARNTMLRVQLSNSITLLPLDRGLIERFAKWLVPRGLTRDECVLYGIDSEGCRKLVAGAEYAE